MRTPWGDATELRARMMRPGRGMPREEAERNHRERLFAAMVACVVEKGYEATRVADLVELSGISRSAFYRQFADKQECFLAAAEELIQPTLAVMEQAERAASGEERMRRGGRGLPAPGRLPAGGLEDVLRRDLRRRAGGGDADRPGAGDIREVRHRAVRADPRARGDAAGDGPGDDRRPAEGRPQAPLPRRTGRPPRARPADLRLVALLPPPPGSLEGPKKRRSKRPQTFEERQVHDSPPDRVLRALAATVAEKGYPGATVAEIVDRASTSQRTFYENFANKEEALLAALDTGSARMLAKTLPAFRRAQDWQQAVRIAYDEMFSFGHEEPEYSRLGAVEMYAAGKRALETRDTIMEGLEALLAPGYELAPATPPIAAEAIGGAIYALVYDHVKAKGPESLPELVPMATYMTLAPVPRRRGGLRAGDRLGG